MFNGFKALLSNEKAFAGGALVIAATVLAALGLMSISDWESYTRLIFFGYIGSEVVHGSVSTWASARKVESLAAAAAPKIETQL